MIFKTLRSNTALVRYFTTTVDKSEVQFFSKLSTEWWNETGALKPLHSLNKLRVPFVREGLIQNGLVTVQNINTSKPLKELKILDVGCGGGILAEPLARLGAQVTGLDADVEAIKVATEHSTKNNLSNITYEASSIEDHALKNVGKYDGIIASEIVEHVTNKENFVGTCVKCLKPGGAIFITTMSRTFLAETLGINIAECMGLVPKGAHEIDKFILPHELQLILEKNNCQTKLVHGMMYVFLTNKWSWISDTSINYGIYAVKCAELELK